MNFIARWFQRSFDIKDSQVRRLFSINGLGRAVWTPRQYENLAVESYVKNAVAYRCVRMISEAAAGIPFLVFVGKKEQSEHEVLKLLQNPNRFEGAFDLMDAYYSFMQLAGQAYLEAVLLNGKPRELFVLRSDRMKIVLGSRGYPVAYEYTIGSNKVRFDVPDMPDQQALILHQKLFHPTNDHYGLSPVEAGAFALDQHNASSAFNKALLDNNVVPSGVLWTEKDLGDDVFNRLKKELDERSRIEQKGRPMLLEGGLKWQAMGFSPQEMALIESKREVAREVCLVFGVPPMLLGIPGDNTYSNYQEANRALYRNAVLPLVDRTCDAFTNFFRPTWNDVVITYNADGIEALATERKELWERVNQATFLTLNEKREAAGYSPVGPEGDVILVGSGQVPLEMVGFEPGGPAPEDEDDAEPEEEAEDDAEAEEDEAR